MSVSCNDLLGFLRSADFSSFLLHFPRIADGLTSAQLDSIGYALQQQHRLAGADTPQGFLANVDVLLLSSSNAMVLPNLLRSTLASNRIWANVTDSGYNQWRFRLMDSAPASSNGKPQVSICVLDESLIFGDLGFTSDVDAIVQKLDESFREIASLVKHYMENSSSFLLLTTPPLLRERQDVLLDFRSKARLAAAWNRFNADLLSLTEQYERIFVIDSALALQGRVPDSSISDPRIKAIAKMYWTAESARALAGTMSRAIRALLGLNKKCLVVDLDNTLWGGILGDDGMDALEVDEGDYGDAYLRFQQSIAALGRQGVILAVCSKNDEANVRNCFTQRKMPLGLDDFSVVTANWNPKDQNIRQIIETLNIGEDSVVFVDDSAFEANLVAKHLPNATVLHLDSDPASYIETLMGKGFFDRVRITDEDRVRNTLYATEEKRKTLRSSFTSMEEYMHDLGLRVSTYPVTEREIHRVAQLTQRTNQFNLTTMRFSEADLAVRLANEYSHTLVIEAEDRFGSYGVVGAVFATRAGSCLTIENFMLSCRVFSRSIEQFVLSEVADLAQRMGCTQLVGHFTRSAKNGNFSNFYLDAGFGEIEAHGNVQRYMRDALPPIQKPSWISNLRVS